MSNGSLSQAEVGALLSEDEEGIDTSPAANPGADPSTLDFAASPKVKGPAQYADAATGVRDAMALAANSSTALIGKSIKFLNPVSSRVPKESLASQIEDGSMAASFNLDAVPMAIIFTPQQAKKIVMHMMGTEDEPSEFDEAHLHSMGELASTISSNVSNSLGSRFSQKMASSNPEVSVFHGTENLPSFPSPNVMKVSFDLSIDNQNMNHFAILIDESGANSWSQKQTKSSNDVTKGGTNMGEMDNFNLDDLGVGEDQIGGIQESGEGSQTMNPVSFPTFQTGGESPDGMPTNYELLLDVQMVLTVELGRTTKYVKDVLKLGEGSIIELDKLAGEPVDLLINGKLIAKGEVVVIDENFGVRVTDIVAPAERLAQISSGAQ